VSNQSWAFARADGAGGIEGDDQLGAERLAVELTLQLSQLLGDLRWRLVGHIGVQLVPEPLGHVDRGFECLAPLTLFVRQQ